MVHHSVNLSKRKIERLTRAKTLQCDIKDGTSADHEVEQRLLEALEFNRTIISDSAIGILIYRATGECVFANNGAAKTIQTTKVQLLHQNFRQIASWKNCNLLAMAEHTLLTGDMQRSVMHITTTFGREVWLDCTCTKLNLWGEPHLLLMTHDNTDQVLKEKIIRDKNRQLQLLQEVAIVVNEAKEVGTALQWVVDQVCEYTGWAVGHVCLPVEGESCSLEGTSIWHLDNIPELNGFKERNQGIIFDTPDSLPMQVYNTGKPVVISDLSKEPDLWKISGAKEAGLHTIMAYPILMGQGAGGVLMFFARERTAPDEMILKVMQQIGTQTGRVVERARSTSALRASEKLFHALIEHGSDVILMIDAQGLIQYVSPSSTRVIDFRPEDMLGQSALQFIHPDEHAKANDYFDDLTHKPNERVTMDLRMLHRTETQVWASVTITNLLHDPAVRAFVVNYHDITERKQREVHMDYISSHDAVTGLYNRAYFEKKMLELAGLDNCPISIIIADVDNMKFANDQFGHHTGDALLCQAADVFRQALRDGDCIARIGGDEFAILLPSVNEINAKLLVQRIQTAITNTNTILSGTIQLQISLGCETVFSGREIEQAFRTADARMYANKHSKSVQSPGI